ncbi:MAG TPA: class I SAM-dependent methyltransferase [Nitriliruptorales bacterium]|nr:class I SAM-dependent methyltransferase [Nitriliruptorales bacterium]
MSGPAAQRWAGLVRDRLEALEVLAPGQGAVGAAFWDERARRYARRVAGTAERDPFLRRVRPSVGRRTVVVDVGAGPGRFALALAPRAGQVVAVDPSERMLSLLRQEARRRGADNVRTVTGRWEEVGDVEGDVVICSYVLPIVADAAGFLAKLDAAARRRVLVQLSAVSIDLLHDPMWRHFHGSRLPPGPTYLDLVAVLRELDVEPHVEVVEAPTLVRFATERQAVGDYSDLLRLPDTAQARRELRGLLKSWLVRDRGALRAPVRTLPAAIVSWEPRSAGA